VAALNNEINDLQKQIKTLLTEKVGGNGNDPNRASPSRMPASERKMLEKARQACGPHAGNEWRKAAV
tara:strand:- start:1640 stop:1840 length:201 start_codon:yes stop_codon:yes gene_type:complete